MYWGIVNWTDVKILKTPYFSVLSNAYLWHKVLKLKITLFFQLSDMGNTIIPCSTLKTILPISAVAASGLTSGFLSAATFMDVPTFKKLIANKDSDTIKKVFAIWWPYGGQFMIHMTLLNFFAHFGSYAVTKKIVDSFRLFYIC